MCDIVREFRLLLVANVGCCVSLVVMRSVLCRFIGVFVVVCERGDNDVMIMRPQRMQIMKPMY